MTKKEKHEIAVAVRTILNDEDTQIRDLYKQLVGSMKHFRSFIRRECVHFWSDGFDPYLDKEYLDYCWFRVGDKIINYDDLWCMIRDVIRDDIERNNGNGTLYVR